jgi:hypothetical protein
LKTFMNLYFIWQIPKWAHGLVCVDSPELVHLLANLQKNKFAHGYSLKSSLLGSWSSQQAVADTPALVRKY